MKYASVCLVLLLFLSPACTKSGTGTQVKTDDPLTMKAEDPVQKVITANVVAPIVVLKNVKSMPIETKPRAAGLVDQEIALAKTCAQQFLEYAAKNGVNSAVAEFTKSQNGVFANYLPKIYFYGVLYEKDGYKVKVVAHATSPDFVGLEVDVSKWKDLTEWFYLKDTSDVFDTGKSNQVLLENVYWKDPKWSGNKPVRFNAYERVFTLEGKTYWMHYTSWVDE